MSCSSCKYLKESKKRVGSVGGCCYYCSKINSYVNGSNNKCEYYEKTYSRNNYECDKIYEDGKDFYDDATPISFYVALAIILTILAIIANI